MGAREYVGVDIQAGPGVDEICEASRLVERFGSEAFDIVVSTELLEHVQEWRSVVSNMKRVLRPGGALLMTTRSIGYPFHAAPFDFWRYEPDDLRIVFADFEIATLERDPTYPGVFLRATRPVDFVERATADVALYSVLRRQRVRSVGRRDILRTALSSPRRFVSFVLPGPIKQRVWRLLPPFVAARLARWPTDPAIPFCGDTGAREEPRE